MKHEEHENLTMAKLLKRASLTAIFTTIQSVGMAGEATTAQPEKPPQQTPTTAKATADKRDVPNIVLFLTDDPDFYDSPISTTNTLNTEQFFRGREAHWRTLSCVLCRRALK